MPSINLEGGSGAKFDGSLDGLDESYGAGAIIEQEIGWPIGPKKASTIAAANAQLDHLARVLAERGVEVSRPDIAFVEYESEDQAASAKDTLHGFKLTPELSMTVVFAKK